jgi:hypothetical protein
MHIGMSVRLRTEHFICANRVAQVRVQIDGYRAVSAAMSGRLVGRSSKGLV